MSKKEHLKAQKLKQDKLKKELEEYEEKERLTAKSKYSKSAKKLAFGEPFYIFIIKMLMLVPFVYSGFFYGGILAAGVLGDAIDDGPPNWVAYCVIIGDVLMLGGIIFAFFKKYIVSFVLALAGTGVFMKSALFMIRRTQKYLNERAVEESLLNLDKEYMKYYYPILGVAFIALVLLIISLVRGHMKKKAEQRLKDTAPVKSIIDSP